MSFSAFNFSVPRPARRMASSGSFKDENKPNGHTGLSSSSNGNGPSAVEHRSSPSLGAWEGEREREGSLGSPSLGHSAGIVASTHVNGNGSHAATDPPPAHQRSFSSLLAGNASSVPSEAQDPLAKPFVYSREFLLSLYDEDKASKKPIELASHEIATTDGGGKPWALREWRNGEKELFASSIHPPSNRSGRSSQHARGGPASDSNLAGGSTGTLDLSSLPTLPRDRERTLAGAGAGTGAGNVSSPPRGTTEKDVLRRARGTLGSGSGMGIMGGALGGIPGAARPVRAASPSKKEDVPKSVVGVTGNGTATKEVWQGGRWRRGGTAELEEEKRLSTLASIKDSADTHLNSAPPADSRNDDDVPNSWDEDSEDVSNKPLSPQAPPEPKPTDKPGIPSPQYPSEPDLAHHASSILGSLALDADPTDDPLSSSTSSRSSQLPPGLSASLIIDRPTSDWQYRDPSGVVQGPFAPALMHDWFKQSFFAGDLRVKRTQDAEFESLDALILRSGDKEQPFLSAQLQPILPALGPSSSSSPWPLQSPPPGEDFGAPQRPFGSFYEPFGGLGAPSSFDSARQQPQQPGVSVYGAPRSASGGLDPWGAPLPPPNPDPTIGQQRGGWASEQGPFGQQQPHSHPHFPQQQQLQPQFPQAFSGHSPVDPFRQLPEQHHHNDPFGRQPSGPASPFFDSSQLSASQPSEWGRFNGLPAQQQFPQQPLSRSGPTLLQQASPQPAPQPSISLAPIGQIGQNSWSALLSPAAHPLPPPAATTAVSSLSPPQPQQPPVAPATAVEAPRGDVPVAPAAPVSVWESVAKAEPKRAEEPIVASPKDVKPADSASINSAIVEKIAPPQPAPVAPAPAPAPTSTPSPAPKAPVVAPWVKEEEVPAPGPSLRQIQEAEAKQAEIRKTAERQAAARTQALAAVQAAQRAAAAEAESLPSSSTWAASPAASPAAKSGPSAAPAPWLKGTKSASVGKTLKEIQDEEEKRKQAVAAAAAQSNASITRGYAGSVSAAAKLPANTTPWTTVAVKPVPIPVAAVARPVIPGGPVTQSQSRIINSLPAKPISAPIRAVNSPQTPSRPASRATATVYDADSPPPPSADFMKWCKDALKGLTVPMDEFIQMLLSFPLDASPDILEIISDSVYANSSTLDGRRFANDFTSRRKLDVSTRYPNIAMSKTGSKSGKPSSMADALRSQPAPKTPEWNVKVAGSKKKKGGK